MRPSKLRRTVLVGSERMVVYDDGSTEPIKIFDHGVVYEDPETFGEYHLSYRTGDIVSPKIDARRADRCSSWRTSPRRSQRREAPAGHLDLARNVARLTEAAEESLRTGGDVLSTGRTRFAELVEPRGE